MKHKRSSHMLCACILCIIVLLLCLQSCASEKTETSSGTSSGLQSAQTETASDTPSDSQPAPPEGDLQIPPLSDALKLQIQRAYLKDTNNEDSSPEEVGVSYYGTYGRYAAVIVATIVSPAFHAQTLGGYTFRFANVVEFTFFDCVDNRFVPFEETHMPDKDLALLYARHRACHPLIYEKYEEATK